MALCVWPCNCYEPDHSSEPDLMWDLDLYARLDLADAWAVRRAGELVRADEQPQADVRPPRLHDGGNPREDLIDHKNPELATKLEHSADWEELSLNHLEGRTAGFFCYGDGGGDELDESGRPKKLRHKQYFDPDKEPYENDRESYAPLVWQCRYSGVEVPEDLWSYVEFGKGKKYTTTRLSTWRPRRTFSATSTHGRIASPSSSHERARSNRAGTARTAIQPRPSQRGPEAEVAGVADRMAFRRRARHRRSSRNSGSTMTRRSRPKEGEARSSVADRNPLAPLRELEGGYAFGHLAWCDEAALGPDRGRRSGTDRRSK